MITAYFDGLCYPRNPCGVAAYGYLIYRDGALINKGCKAVGEGTGMTNNVAEYEGIKAVAQWIHDNDINEKIEIRGDSQLVIKQLRGVWKVNSETSKKYVPEIKRLLQGKDVSFVWVPREKNEEADRMSREGYDIYKRSRGTYRR